MVVHHLYWNDDSRLKLTGNLIQWDSEIGFYWYVNFSSPQAELLLVSVLISTRIKLYFGFNAASSKTSVIDFSIYKLNLLEK